MYETHLIPAGLILNGACMLCEALAQLAKLGINFYLHVLEAQ